MRNFFMTFFSVKGLEQKIDRFVDYFHCPLEDEVDNWWEKNYTSSNTYNYISTHTAIYTISNSSIPYRNNIPVFYYDIFSD